MKLSSNAIQLLNERYLWKGETFEDMCLRVATFIGFNNRHQSKIYYDMLVNLEFLPNSPCLFNAGKNPSYLSACYILEPKDDFKDIMTNCMHQGLIQKTGGGVGFNFSNLRPEGSPLSTGGTASGVVSFMTLYDAVAQVVKQRGLRLSRPDYIGIGTDRRSIK